MTAFLRLVLSAVMAFLALAILHLLNNGNFAGFAVNSFAFTNLFALFAITSFVSPIFERFSHIKLSSADRERGTVKWFNVNKGYGFVTRANGEDLFVHFRSIQGKGRRVLFEGQEVEYSIGEGEKGPQAEEVEPIKA